VVVLPDHLTLLLTTGDIQVSERVDVKEAELNAAVAAYRAALIDPRVDPRPAGGQMYDLLLRKLEPALVAAKATTVLAWMDGVLRYIPLSALHDGERFVVERWGTVVYTSASQMDLGRAPNDAPTVAAFGVSQAATVTGGAFAALPGVPGELDAVVREGQADTGAVAGRTYLDEGFTAESLKSSLVAEVPWIHIASHFRFQPGGNESNNYLLLGGGQTLTVEDLRLKSYDFGSVDLLALSACETAMSSPNADGSEVEGLAVVAQNKGARAVLATLWPVADGSTSAWMADLYGRLVAEPVSRAQAVREVQLDFLKGKVDSAHLPDAARGLVPLGAPPLPTASFPEWTHPYYWAPFVLYGTGG